MSTAEVIPLPRKLPDSGELIKLVRRLAANGAIAFNPNAFDQGGTERGIDINDAKLILQTGEIKGGIVPGHLPGDWKCKVVNKMEGSSGLVGVMAVVMGDSRLCLLTAEREDT